MNKRDYFAAQAMQAIIAKMPLTLRFEGDSELDVEILMQAVATGAYGYADAMMEQRDKEQY